MANKLKIHPSLSPPLKWAGGKRWLVPHLRQAWARHPDRRLVEPFAGSLAVALGLQPRRALLNDINPHLINFYTWLQRGLKLETPFTNAVDNDSDRYYAHRQRFNDIISTPAGAASAPAAALFYYLNRTGYNGLCRFNRRGQFNVPFGRYRTINYLDDFHPYQALLSEWAFSAQRFDALLIQPDDFIYADPPYDVEFVSYAREGFTWDDQVTLAGWLARHPGPVVASNQATERIVALYQEYGFEIIVLDAPRRISCTGDRTPAQEILAFRHLEKRVFADEIRTRLDVTSQTKQKITPLAG